MNESIEIKFGRNSGKLYDQDRSFLSLRFLQDVKIFIITSVIFFKRNLSVTSYYHKLQISFSSSTFFHTMKASD